ncbi:MAG: zincin-like metallopeptidase domain-containing protein [Bacteroidales bacterium]|nr:zincin-like metallopeptidase domain-containing protein [Bacteroidales bacterium]
MAGRKNYNNDGKSAEDRTLDKFAELLIGKLETIQADWKKPWFTEGVSASLPKNLSGREYNGMNSMMLMLHAEKEGFKLPVWATFDRITGLNYVKDKQGAKQEAKDSEGNNLPLVSVNKGAKSFPVFITTFTVIDKETKEKIKYDDYKRMSEEDRAKYNVYPKLQTYNVFNVEGQTNLKEARPELFKKLQEQNEVTRPVQQEGEMFSFPAVDHMIAENKWICPIKPTYGDNAYFSISKNEIVVPEKRQFKSGESFYSNLAHEMAHSTGAENQLNRLKPSSFGSKEYAREELVAEMSAAIVSQRYGMSKTLKEDSLPYLKSWLDSLKEEPAFIKTVLQDVKKASGMINQHIDKVLMELDKAEEVKQETTNQVSANYGSYDIPKWALPYIVNGDASGISDHEQELVDKFLVKNFPDGFIPEIEEGEGKELNLYPAFGDRNENALTDRGESPYLAVDTVSVKFGQPGYMESKSDNKDDGYTYETVVDNTKEQMAAKGVPMVEAQQDEQPHYHFGR